MTNWFHRPSGSEVGLLLIALLLAACGGRQEPFASPTPNLPGPSPVSGPSETPTPARRLPTPAASATPTASPTPLPGRPTATSPPASGAPQPLPRLEPGQELRFAQVHRVDGNVGWGISAAPDQFQIRATYNLLRTEDGGRTWREVTPPQRADPNRLAVAYLEAFFLDGQRAWVVVAGAGSEASVWRSDDGGRSWRAAAFIPRGGLSEAGPILRFSGPDDGWMLISYFLGASSYEADILRSYDGGRTWTSILLQEYGHGPIRGFDVLNANVAWMSAGQFGSYRLHLTRDGAVSWREVEPHSPADPLPLQGDCALLRPEVESYTSGRVLRACRLTSGLTSYHLGYSDDAGRSWRYVDLPGEPFSLGETDGWAVAPPQGEGEPSRIFRTMDGGSSWEQVSQLPGRVRLSFADSQRGWALSDGSLFTTADGGESWTGLEPELAAAPSPPRDETEWIELPADLPPLDRDGLDRLEVLAQMAVQAPTSLGASERALYIGSEDGRLARWEWGTELRVPPVLPQQRAAASWLYEVEALHQGPGWLAAGRDGRAYRYGDFFYATLEVIGGGFGEISGVADHPQGVFTGGQDGVVRLWSPPQEYGQPWTVARGFTGHAGWVWDVASAPDQELLASAGADGSVRLWAVASGEQLRLLTGHRAAATRVRFSPDGRLLASASRDGTVRLWRVADGSEIAVLRGHSGWVHDVAFSPAGDLLATVGSSGALNLWHAPSGELLRSEPTAHGGAARGVVFRPDGRLVATVGADNALRLWGVGR